MCMKALNGMFLSGDLLLTKKKKIKWAQFENTSIY